MRLIYLLLLSLIMNSNASGQTWYFYTFIGETGKMAGNGGIISLDSNSSMAIPFHTACLYRKAITEPDETEITIYK